MFRYIPQSDFLEIAVASASSTATGSNVDRVRLTPISVLWESVEGTSARLTVTLEDSVAVPRVFAAINTAKTPGQTFRVASGSFDSGVIVDQFRWGRIQIAELDESVGNRSWQMTFAGAESVWRCGYIVVAENWIEAELPQSVRVSSEVPQLSSDGENATPIYSVAAGKKRIIELTWTGDFLNDPKLIQLMDMFDELEDKQRLGLIQPRSDQPLYFFGRLQSWNKSRQGNQPWQLSATFKTDGLAQPTFG